MQRRRVVVTGLGIISPVGNTVPEAWDAVLAGKSGITRVTLDTGVPIANGILTTEDDDQALSRMQVKGADCAQAARGASALIDNARWCGNLMKMTSEEAETLKEISGLPVGEDRRGFFVRYEIGKQNYGQVQGGQWYERTAGGVLRPVNLVKASRSSAKNDARRRDDI